MRILVTRPEPAAAAQAAQLCQRGHEPLISPLLRVVPVSPDLPGVLASTAISAVIATSRNALTAIARDPLPAALRPKPVFCVGPATAALAREAGFQNVVAGDGNAEDLASLIQKMVSPCDGALLRLTGDIPSGAPATLGKDLELAGYTVREIVCYRIVPVAELTPEAAVALREGRIGFVILMSPLTAKTYISAVGATGLTVQSEKLRYVCLSSAVADELFGFPQESIFIADKPNHWSVLSVVDRAVAKLS